MTRKIKAERAETPFDHPAMTKKFKTEPVEDHQSDLTIRNKAQLTAFCRSTPEERTYLYSINPPHCPQPLQRASCDIVLVIDVSGSMFDPAPLPDAQDSTEDAALSILDLVKHAALTIIETLGPKDRLGLVTFSTHAETIHTLTKMTGPNKKTLQQSIKSLREDASTNLWAGIKAGLEVFEEATDLSNVQGLYILTDGMPNHMCPAQGYATKLKPLLNHFTSPPTIHTFGFGYHLRSGLLQTIAEVGLGRYAFIPDAGMIGTVFVHAVANLYSTFATQVKLRIHTPDHIHHLTVFNATKSDGEYILHLGNLQYGQSRDIIISGPPGPPAATLEYTTTTTGERISFRFHFIEPQSNVLNLDIHYHLSRTHLVELLSTLLPTIALGEHIPLTTFDPTNHAHIPTTMIPADVHHKLDLLVKTMTPHLAHPGLHALLNDIHLHPHPTSTDDYNNPPPTQPGQITLSLQTPHFIKWGQHYLPSLLHAHATQTCNSFKDPGVLIYSSHSPLFLRCRDTLDAAFEKLPSPKPSREAVVMRQGRKVARNVNMRRFHDPNNMCFLGGCGVRLADGCTVVRVEELRVDMAVWTPRGERRVAAIVKTLPQAQPPPPAARAANGVESGAAAAAAPANGVELVRVGELWVTPWHPILHPMTRQWTFPCYIADEISHSNEAVYSLLLEPDADVDAHAVEVGGVVSVTLGHGLTSSSPEQAGVGGDEKGDVRAHAFFGDYESVKREVAKLPKDGERRCLVMGVRRCVETGKVVGFRSGESSGERRVGQGCSSLIAPAEVPAMITAGAG